MALGFIDASGGLGPQADPNSSPPQAPSGGPGVNGQNANCNWIDDDCAQTGGVGGPGSRGIDGVPGGPGGNGGSIDFEADVINGSVQFLVRGGRGGQGQRGGQGGNGGKGGRGGDGDDCEFGRHGGSGGPSGSGGAGGAGGRGGNGGSIFVRVRTPTTRRPSATIHRWTHAAETADSAVREARRERLVRRATTASRPACSPLAATVRTWGPSLGSVLPASRVRPARPVAQETVAPSLGRSSAEATGS